MECICPPPSRAGEARFDLAYRKPETDGEEAGVAAQLNTRLRLSDGGPMFESMGWDWGGPHSNLIFGVPAKYVPEGLSSVEIWWATAGRTLVTVLPCRPMEVGMPQV